MTSDRPETRLAPYARLPRAHHDHHVLHSSVDAFGRAHWLLTEHPPADSVRGGARSPRSRDRDALCDLLVVTVGDGAPYETRLTAVPPRFPRVEALPDGGFLLLASRSRPSDGRQVQVFDALGRPTDTFRVGDAVSHCLVDESGALWVGHFDEGVYGDDELSAPGLSRWSSSGERLWSYRPVPGADWISDCYALNVSGRTAWACPYTDFPLLRIDPAGAVRVRRNLLRGAKGFAVHGGRVVFLGGYGDDHDRIADCRLTGDTVEVGDERRLTRPDGSRLDRGSRIVSRGARLYVQDGPRTEWWVLDLA
ncbi:hypothetical protein AQI95_22400 [Streptomyces yokosukanensis]|uniref:SMP-30/Gluconolactonase/LRE-like region domain-containing protein n=1 Tax=Streptomyces yokosukanensis TaxID=67386 RepID=A0A101P1N7_9ACTN|nr:hypothetical protein [Streptomyces yokosukanensis]KUN03276.1 hypothetical protein AQI95_22400 [Streptomyces yokosukanensis]